MTTATQSRTVLICPFGHVLSHVARTLMIARGLREIGCRVIFAGEGHYLELARQDGFEVQPLVEIDFAAFLAAVRKPFAGAGITEEWVERMLEDELRLYREVKPDLVLYDLRSTAASAQLAGIPHVALVNAYLTRYSATRWVNFPPLARLVLEPLRRRLNIAPINRVRRRHGLPPLHVWEALYSSDLVLMPDVPEFAPTRDLPAHMHYIGPLVWEPAGELPDALNRFDPDRRVLYFTLGSTGLPHLFKRVIEVLRSTDFYVIVSTGNHVTPADLGLLPDTFWTASFWPGSQVVRRCDVVICHGGNTTIYQALAAGVPVIAIPTHMDQRLNAELLVNTGCGMFLAPEAVGQIGQKVTEVLSRPSYYKENAVRMQKVLAGYDGPRTAVWLILGHIGCSLT